jgi:FAD/FMN-containing dehydrogenase
VNPPRERIDALLKSLPALDWCTSPADVKRKSLDYHWFSPVLRRELEGKSADAVVRPRNAKELREIVTGCVRENVPLTMRGGGTGNYGQAVPLEGGIVIEMTACDQLLWLKHGVARAQAGIKLGVLEELLVPQGWELRCMPSTYRMATLGGLFCGGFGGIGSITYGPLSAPGTVLGIQLMTVEAEPRVIEVRSPQAMQHAHTYGTNGIILELEIALAPALEWDEYLITFRDADADAAFGCGQAVAQTPGLIKRETAVFDASVVSYFKKLSPYIEAGDHALIVVMSSANRETLQALVNTAGGRIAFQQTGAVAKTTQHTLLEYCWNHTTLHALRGDKSLTYLQTTYEYGREREQLALVKRQAGGEVMNHIEFIRDEQGRMICSGLPLVRFTNENRLREIIAIHRECGVGIKDPHVYTLEDGTRHGAMSPAGLAAKRRFDPGGLLNPGKLRSHSSASSPKRNERD